MSPKTILVVEDDLAIREAVVELLKEEGYPKVAAARHGKVALSWLEAQTELPGLILLDLMMPVMDGESFMEALQSHPRAALHDVPHAYDAWYYHLPFAARIGGIVPAELYVFNAANEAAVQAFLDGRIRFLDIDGAVADVLARIDGSPAHDLDDLIEADRSARSLVRVEA